MDGNSADSDKSVTQHPHTTDPDLDLGDVKMEDRQTEAMCYNPSCALTVGHFEQRIAQHDQSIKAYIRQELSDLSLTGPKTKPMDMVSPKFAIIRTRIGCFYFSPLFPLLIRVS